MGGIRVKRIRVGVVVLGLDGFVYMYSSLCWYGSYIVCAYGI